MKEQLEQEIANLQVLLMEQQVALETLGEQVLAHGRRFDALEKLLQLMEIKLNAVAESDNSGEDSASLHEKPPHY